MKKNYLTLTAESSIIHGGQVLGTNQYLHREKFLLQDGSIEEIPVITGNAFRGALRDHAAQLYIDFLGDQELPLPVVQALWSGGTVTKAKGLPLSGEKLRKLREVAPPLSIFGFACAGRIVSGSLSVGKILPICSELSHLIPSDILDKVDNLSSYWDITQLEEFSRFPDDESREGLMRYGSESFIPGTKFYTWYQLRSRNSLDDLFWNHLLADLSQGLIQIGGKKSKGAGVISASGLITNPPLESTWESHLQERWQTNEILTLLQEIQ